MSSRPERLKDEGSRLQVTAAGATAGLISRFVIAPLDVVKIRLQLQTHSPSAASNGGGSSSGPVYRGTLQTLRHVMQHEGITGLWKGNVPAELLYICYSAVQFTAYRSATVAIHQTVGESQLPQAAESFLAGAVSGAAATSATYPLDLLRTRFAAQGNDRVYTSLRRAVVQIAQDEGVRGFFRGLSPGLAQIVPFMGMFFAVYETLRPQLARLDHNNAPLLAGVVGGGSSAAVAGVVASVVAKTGSFPFDLVRKRIQVQGPTRSRYVHKNIPEYSGTVGTVRTILMHEGFRGLYRGLTVSLIKAAPASAVTMWTYERALHFYMALGEKETNRDL
ncbi:mitochondrial carrier domain-containing protein [Lasiosphaeria miniovina]|uniref:Mitochondrial thiamine pyrophosphate carrier 1 n=1 Tax=Lasiosphaeria miniovina TaxID=1954250 RepID=A0AA40BFR2_9PEZI|nr:mitochondrial carrier domain-containing protein [Lasiosphaeria miniovina]KAK0733410.1 mitochondrial carrier domain-containing protein [Lasiosphaeria miniovina]